MKVQGAVFVGQGSDMPVEELELADPGVGEVLVRYGASGLCHSDLSVLNGTLPIPGPSILGHEGAGTVEAVGPGVDPSLTGTRVAALADPDAFADIVVAGADWLAEVPEGVNDADASMLSSAAPTALGVVRAGRITAGETVLVHAGAGAIGHLAVQLARLEGAGTVIATSSSPAKLDFARELGADAAVDYTTDDWPDRVREAAPDGVDVVLDSVSGEVRRRSFGLLAPFGRVVVYGAASGDVGEIAVTDLYMLHSVVGFSLLAYRAAAPKQAADEVTELVGHFAAGRLRTSVHTRLPLTEVAAAHRILESRENLGRVLLVP